MTFKNVKTFPGPSKVLHDGSGPPGIPNHMGCDDSHLYAYLARGRHPGRETQKEQRIRQLQAIVPGRGAELHFS